MDSVNATMVTVPRFITRLRKFGYSETEKLLLAFFYTCLCIFVDLFLPISVRSPGLPGLRFMMLEYRVPVYRNQRCSGLTAH